MTEVPTEDLPGRTTPDGVDDATVEALGKLSEALETCERARGHLYEARLKQSERTTGLDGHAAQP